MIGLYDCDLLENKKFIPNPEIMLLSSYFKSKQEIVQLLPNLDNIDLYKRVFIRKNRRTKAGSINPEFYSRENVDFGGLFFTNDVYVPLPQEVLDCTPDPTIYDNYMRQHPEIKSTDLNAHFLSIRKGENVVEKKKVFIIDADITEKDFDFLNSIQKKTSQQVFHFYYPPSLNTLEGAIQFLSAPWVPTSEKINLNWAISYDEIKLLYRSIEKKKRWFLDAFITDRSRIPNQDSLDRLVVDTLRKIFFCVNNDFRCWFKLHPSIRKKSMPILDLLCAWSHNPSITSFYNYASTRGLIIEQCDRIMKKNPSTRMLFKTNPYEFTKQGGIWNYGT